MMRGLNQIVQVTLLNAHHILERPGTVIAVVISIAGAVSVNVSFLAVSDGFRRTLVSAKSDGRVIVVHGRSDTEVSSRVPREQATWLADLPNVGRDRHGRPLASAELIVKVPLQEYDGRTFRTVTFRGVQTSAFTIRDEVTIVEGRRFERGVRELIVGRTAAQRFAGLGTGSRIAFRGSDWTVVGAFESGGGENEAEIWADAETVLSAFRREAWQSVALLLVDPSDRGLSDFKAAIDRDPRLSLEVRREREYHETPGPIPSMLFNAFAYTVAAFIAVGATVGASRYMAAAIDKRQIEIAVLHAIGFGAAPVVAAVMIEALLLALLGGIAGNAIAYFSCSGASPSILRLNTGSLMTFDVRVTPRLLGYGLGWALVIGAASGLLPAVQAGRSRVPSMPPSPQGGRRSPPMSTDTIQTMGQTERLAFSDVPPRVAPAAGGTE